MPRRNVPSRRNGRTPAPAPSGGGWSTERVETWQHREYRVRSVAGSGSAGPYRCPGCDQLLAASVPHVVAWPAEESDAESRRHWHTACWNARERRRPTVERSRNAPRYS
jgi:hypothetical protein